MSQQAIRPFLHHKRVPCFLLTHFRAYWWSLLSNIHSSLSERRIFKHKDTNFQSKNTLFNKKTRLWNTFFYTLFSKSLCKTLKIWGISMTFDSLPLLKEIENFAKQISIYSNPNIILFALSFTALRREIWEIHMTIPMITHTLEGLTEMICLTKT